MLSIKFQLESNKAIIDQLVLRTFDIKIPEANVILNDANVEKVTDLTNNQISSTSLNYDAASSSQERSNLQSTVPPNDGGVSSSTEINTDSNALSKQSKDALLSYVASTSTTENLLSPVNNSVMNTSISSIDLNCSDEFVNTDLLDSKILRNLAANIDDASVSKDDVITSQDKLEDSDIEILEDTESEKDLNTPKKKDLKDDTRTADSASSEQKIEEKNELASCDTAEDKFTPEETSADTADTKEKLLTLNDIKHTGLTGCDLYKCAYADCNFTAMSADLLKIHIKHCSIDKSNRNLSCAHCDRHFGKIGFFMEHLKVHGLKRFGCSRCHMRFAVGYQAASHMRIKHKSANTKMIPADPTNPSADGLFVVHSCVSFSSPCILFLC